MKGIMAGLPTGELPHLRGDFIANPGGLSLYQYIRSMIKRLNLAHSQLMRLNSWLICGTCLNKSTSMVMAQPVEWGELTRFVIEAGMTSGKQTAAIEQTYQEI